MCWRPRSGRASTSISKWKTRRLPGELIDGRSHCWAWLGTALVVTRNLLLFEVLLHKLCILSFLALRILSYQTRFSFPRFQSISKLNNSSATQSRGRFANVRRCVHKATSAECAAKVSIRCLCDTHSRVLESVLERLNCSNLQFELTE